MALKWWITPPAAYTQGKTGKLEQPAYKTWFERGLDSRPCDNILKAFGCVK